MCKTVVPLIGKPRISSKSCNLEFSSNGRCFHLALPSFLFCLLLSILGVQALFFFGCLAPSATFTHLLLFCSCNSPCFSYHSVLKSIFSQLISKVSCKNTGHSILASGTITRSRATQFTKTKFQVYISRKVLLEILNKSSLEDCNFL